MTCAHTWETIPHEPDPFRRRCSRCGALGHGWGVVVPLVCSSPGCHLPAVGRRFAFAGETFHCQEHAPR